MLPDPTDSDILAAVASYLNKLSSQSKPNWPAARFSLKMASGLTAMVGRERALRSSAEQAQHRRLKARYPDQIDLQTALIEEIRRGDLSQQDWTQLNRLLREDLCDQLKVIAPHFDTRLEVERS